MFYKPTNLCKDMSSREVGDLVLRYIVDIHFNILFLSREQGEFGVSQGDKLLILRKKQQHVSTITENCGTELQGSLHSQGLQ